MREIALTQGYSTQVSDEDFEVLNLFPWHFCRCYKDVGYASMRDSKFSPLIRMHRMIMRRELEEYPELIVDHIDRDTLNNQRENLRLVTKAQNAANRSVQSNNKSGIPGVCYCKRTRKWKVSFKGQSRGYFVEFDDAVTARRFIEETEGAF